MEKMHNQGYYDIFFYLGRGAPPLRVILLDLKNIYKNPFIET